MDKIAKLKLRAVRERDAAIKKARDKYAKRLAELREISRVLKLVERRQFSGKSYRQPCLARLALRPSCGCVARSQQPVSQPVPVFLCADLAPSPLVPLHSRHGQH